MKIIYKEFLCPECGNKCWLNSQGLCVNCRDKLILEEIAQTRKLNDHLYHAKMIS